MTKQHFIALADAIRDNNRTAETCPEYTAFTPTQLNVLAAFCSQQNSRFDRAKWLGYIAGTNGQNGGKIKAA